MGQQNAPKGAVSGAVRKAHQRANSTGWQANWAEDHAGRPRPEATEARVRIGALLEPACSQHVADRVFPPGAGSTGGRGAQGCPGVEGKAISVTEARAARRERSPANDASRRSPAPRWWCPVGRRPVQLTHVTASSVRSCNAAWSSSMPSSRSWCRASRSATSVLAAVLRHGRLLSHEGWLPHR